MKNKIIHKRSSTIIDGKAKLPEVEQLEYGEIAINYADGVETIVFKNDNDEIVEIKSNEYFEQVIEDNELVTAAALTNLDQRINFVKNSVNESETQINGINEILEKVQDNIEDISAKVFIGTQSEYDIAYANGKIGVGALVIILDGSETEEGGATISALLGTAILGQMLLGQQ